MGYEYEETQTTIEETKTGAKRKIEKYKKKAQQDMNAARYLLIIKFGRDYNDKKEEIYAILFAYRECKDFLDAEDLVPVELMHLISENDV